jgi:hypothetical protein
MPNAKDLYDSLKQYPKQAKLSPGAQTLYTMQSESLKTAIRTRGKDGGVRSANERQPGAAERKELERIDKVLNPQPIPIKFGKKEYEQAKKDGYSDNDINDFLRMEGLEVDSTYQGFEAAGLGTGKDGKQYLQWRLDAQNPVQEKKKEEKKSEPKKDNPTQVIVKSEAGTAGITTLGSQPVVAEDPKVTAPAPILGDPLGDTSQRVVRETARKTLTTV